MLLKRRAMVSKSSILRMLSAVAVSGCVAAGLAPVVHAQGLPGLVIFSGVERENQLNYRLDFNGRPFQTDRYRLRISRQKMRSDVYEFTVTYPDTYQGTFDENRIELRVRGNSVPLNEVIWNRETREITIYPTEPVPAGSRVEIVLSNVRNPRNGGTFYFNALVRATGDVPLRRYIGTWIIGIGRE